MNQEKKDEKKGHKGPTSVGPGSTGTDSPIIITDGSFQMFSFNDDFYPRNSTFPDSSSASTTFTVYKVNTNNNTPVTFRSDAGNFQSMAATWTIKIMNNNSTVTITISGTGSPWAITVLTPVQAGLVRQAMNFGEALLKHANITADKKVFLTNFNNTNPQTPLAITNFSLHFR